jgi:hypothetical protein
MTVSGSPATVTGLTDGLSYTFNVAATNAVSTGAASASNAVIPVGPPLGQPNNTAAGAQALGFISCGQSLNTNGISANDGSNAWYTVTFQGPASLLNAPCTPRASIGGNFTVFDIFPGSFSNTPVVQNATSWLGDANASLASGSSQLYYIHVYDPQTGAVASQTFSLSLSIS